MRRSEQFQFSKTVLQYGRSVDLNRLSIRSSLSAYQSHESFSQLTIRGLKLSFSFFLLRVYLLNDRDSSLFTRRQNFTLSYIYYLARKSASGLCTSGTEILEDGWTKRFEKLIVARMLKSCGESTFTIVETRCSKRVYVKNKANFVTLVLVRTEWWYLPELWLCYIPKLLQGNSTRFDK